MPFYTRTGDDGYTGLLGEGRLTKFDLIMEGLGSLDEANAALGFARSVSRAPGAAAILLRVQRDLYGIMAELAATPENLEKFRSVGEDRVTWLEEQMDQLDKIVLVPKEFIIPGDSLPGAALDLARTVVRRAERRLAELIHVGTLANSILLKYLNRLSTLIFVLELQENQQAGVISPTLAKNKV
jgi:cob(I)alamin adenosyltransferase